MSVFSLPGFYVEYHITFSQLFSLSSCWVWQFLWLSLFLTTMTFLRAPGQIFCNCPSIGIHLIFLFSLEWEYGFLQGRPPKWSTILITPYPRHMLSEWLTSPKAGLSLLAEAVFVRFHSVKFFFVPFLHWTFWKVVTMWCSCLKNGSYVPPLWGKSIYVSYLEFFCKGRFVSSLPFLFIK